jgi:hypothetical protein
MKMTNSTRLIDYTMDETQVPDDEYIKLVFIQDRYNPIWVENYVTVYVKRFVGDSKERGKRCRKVVLDNHTAGRPVFCKW